MIIVYGIPTCDTTKKAMAWLKRKNIPFRFHDYRADGIDKTTIDQWCTARGWENILNKKSATWRNLSPQEQATVTDQASAVEVLVQQNTLIKRPILEKGSQILIGFDEKVYAGSL